MSTTKRVAVNLPVEDIDHIRRHLNPLGIPFAMVLASIIREVVRDDRASHAATVAASKPKHPERMARR